MLDFNYIELPSQQLTEKTMISKSHLLRATSVLALILLAAPSVRAQADSTMYLAVDCMKSTSPDYGNVEREIWKPMHQELVDQGKKLSWALFSVEYGSRAECDYYTVNRYMGAAALDSRYDDLESIFKKVHPEANIGEAFARTDASRKVVWTQLYAVVGGIPPKSFKYVHVNRMLAADGEAYVKQEMTMFKPVHEALIADSVTTGWLVYRLISPVGSAMGYNFGTVDFADHAGPIPFGWYVKKAHPDVDRQAFFEQVQKAREHVLGETWRLVARTKDPGMMNGE